MKFRLRASIILSVPLLILSFSLPTASEVQGPCPCASPSPTPLPSPTLTTISTYFGGALEDTVRDITTDSAGNIYITGGTASNNFVATVGDQTFNGVHDVFVAKFSPAGQFLWSTLLGGPNYDRAYAIEVDATGIYLGGRAGAGFPTTAGVLQTSFGGDSVPNALYGQQDGFIAKLSLDGNVLWATYVGGGDSSFFRDIAIDDAGNVYGALTEVSLVNPYITSGAYQPALGGGMDGVIIKLASDGAQVIWATYFGGSGYDVGTPSIRVNANNEVWVLGFTNSANIPTSTDGYDRTYNGGGDLHLAKFSSDGAALLYATYFGGSAVEYSETHGLAIDSAGNMYLTGTTKSANLPTTTGAIDTSYNGEGGSGSGNNTNYDGDGFVAEFSSSGQLLASTYLGGTLGDGLEGIGVSSDGRVLVSGASYSINFPVTPGAFRTSRAGSADVVLSVLNSNLTSLVYSSYIGGSNIDYGRSAWADGANFYVAGQSKSTNYPLVGAHQTTLGGNFDGVLTRLVVP